MILIGCQKDPITYNLTVAASPFEGGIVNPNSGSYNEGETVVINAVPNNFYAFKNWSGSWAGSSPTIILTMDTDKQIFANFEKNDDRAKNGWEMSPLNLVLGKAEETPFEKDSFDILNCVYLFHELPNEIRRECAKEFFRVLKPGGLLAFNDSIQANDREGMTAETMKVFPNKYHEPYYVDYVQDDLTALFEEAGFVQFREPEVANRSKVLSFIKKPSEKFEECDLSRDINEVCNGGEETKETIMKSETQ